MPTRLRIIHFDVSQGESSLISLLPALGDAKHVLIDGGKLSRGKYVRLMLEKLGVTKLDAIVCTHPDGDHHEGLTPVVEGLAEVTRLYAPRDVSDFHKYTKLKKACEDAGTTWVDARVNTKLIDSAGCLLKIVHVGRGTVSDDNPASIGCTLKFHDFTYFTAGDLPLEDEEGLGLGHMCAFKCGHHGAETSTSRDFVDAITPTAAFISAGHHNHDHPRQSVLDILCATDSLQRFYTTNCEPMRTGFVNRGTGAKRKGFAASARLQGVMGHLVLYTDDTLAKNHDGAGTTFRVAHPQDAGLGGGFQWKWYAHICAKDDHVPEAALAPVTAPLAANELPEFRLEALSTTIQTQQVTTPTYSFADLLAASRVDTFKRPSSPIREYMGDPDNFLKDPADKKRKTSGSSGSQPKKKAKVYVHQDDVQRMSQCVWCGTDAMGSKPPFRSKCDCNLDWYVCSDCKHERKETVDCDLLQVAS
ncbi:hypothetical protein OV208_30490 [Corallococcus sp. bb12-1]|uniref:ComEC/Rec2 family competence protein n=1 Tax=Corallococcus sp. bb12-1 TaxID=2996784 RepID=UPI002271119E|nr:hypothetical protein [Corallococcus sp. bb12-1]MCY1045681.1 hypothetical protein [Corallococcus sp. bb12-1]